VTRQPGRHRAENLTVTDTSSTRARLIQAAEHLLAERGVEAVSLREIGRAAGARNIAASQYHFKDRAGLIAAILEKHTPVVSASRHRLLDDCADGGEPPVRSLVGALVRPLALKLDDEDGGPEYLRIYAELVNRPTGLGVPLVEGPRNSIERWAAMIEPWLGPEGDIFHRRFLAVRITAAELARRARVRPSSDHSVFTEHLIDVLAAMLLASAAPETIASVRGGRKRSHPPFRADDREL
jgi:AcrR family transcriptional regulator